MEAMVTTGCTIKEMVTTEH